MESTLLRKSKEQLERFKVMAEELEVQLALGKAEAKDTFKREQKNFKEYINQQKREFALADKTHESHRKELLMMFEKLEESLNLEIPTAKKFYDSYKKKVMGVIYELEFMVSEYGEEVDVYMEGNLAKFKELLDAYRIQLALSENKDLKRTVEYKEMLGEKVAEIRVVLQKESEEDNKIEVFVEEVSASFDHLKKAFSDLLN